jgi:hypothetical protein
MRYEGYSVQERIDDILDKISKYGITSLTPLEKEFLDSNSSGQENEVHDKIKYLENDQIFEDDAGPFKFEYKETEEFENETHHIGTLYVPDLDLGNGEIIEGRLEGKIISYINGQTALEFEKDGYDIFEFCNGLEYEIDTFVDYVIEELKEEKR